MPKTIGSPSRLSNTQNHRHLHHHNHGKSIGDGGGLWCNKNHMGSDLSEPTSPKVTSAGQIRGRPKSVPCKNWQSVMEEIERLHNNKKHRKKPAWGGALGFKKESMQFLTCLRSFKLDLGCFGAFPNANVTSDDDQEDDDDKEEINHENKLVGFRGYDHEHDDYHEEGSSRSAFSKFFMVLEKNQECALHKKEEIDKAQDDDDEAQAPGMPPSNALLLMRSRSAPAKSWLEEKEEEEEDDDDDNHNDNDGKEHDDNDGEEEDGADDEMKRENLMEVMKYECDFYKLSCDIAKETWIAGGINKDSFSRTQSSKRCSTECLEEVKACLQ
ncbi:hypothetical protein L2E82_47216 [Cichorium intybus]|uniref:Uncharacterized protein n=1 Tax=Cichorium intybus TaxID=13427 RepID=A0ACB8YV63_CICIN|nr:hypothetical protein L2E82_47216 [Cichorium intybus]